MGQMTLVGICGSLRAASLNRAMMHQAAEMFDPETFIDADLNLPLYNQEIEEAGIPDSVTTLADQIKSADAVIIAGPEYNKSLSGVLKNALDWVSRVKGSPFNGKPVAIVSATAGRTGGEMAQAAMRDALHFAQPRLIAGPPVLVAAAHNELSDGALGDGPYKTALADLMANLRAAAA